MRIMITPRDVNRVHAPEMEQAAYNQKPKTLEHDQSKLYRYENTQIFQWWSRPRGLLQPQPFAEPFVLEQEHFILEGRTAFVKVVPHSEGKPTHKNHVVRLETTTDVPADVLGEACCLAMQRAWKSGLDPVVDKLTLVVSFE